MQDISIPNRFFLSYLNTLIYKIYLYFLVITTSIIRDVISDLKHKRLKILPI